MNESGLTAPRVFFCQVWALETGHLDAAWEGPEVTAASALRSMFAKGALPLLLERASVPWRKGDVADLCRPRRYNVGAMVRTKRPCRLFAFRCSRGGGGALANPMAVGDATQTKDLNSKRCWIWLEWIEPSKRKTKSAEPTHHPKLRDAQAVSV